MEQKEIFKNLIQDLFKENELHSEYQDNDIHFAIDSVKEDDNTLNIKIRLIDNKDKKDFEKWLEQVDDNLFGEVLKELADEGLIDLEKMYNSSQYKVVIDKVKDKTKEIVTRKIEEFKKLI